MSAYAQQLFDAYRRAAKAGADVMDLAATENREMTPEETETRDKALEDVGRIKAEIDKVQNFEEVRKAGDVFREAVAPKLERATGNPDPSAAFRSIIRDGGALEVAPSYVTARLKEHPELTLRALATSSSTVETSFADFVTVYERTLTPMFRPDVVTLIETSTGNPLVFPRETADPSLGSTLTAEAGGITEADATFSSVTLNPYKFAGTNLYSRELAEDNSIQIEDIIARTTARAILLGMGGVLTTGDGSSKPQGFVPVAANAGTATGTSATLGTYFGPKDLIDLFYSRAQPYRAVGTWMANATTISQIRKSADNNNQLIWQPSLILGQPETLLGRPLVENPDMANGSAAKAVAFGDFSRFVVHRVVPIRVEASIHYKFASDQVALRTIERVDSDLIDAVAVAVLVNAAV